MLRANIERKSAFSLQRGQFDPKFQVEGVTPTNHSLSQKTRLNDLSYSIKIWTDLSFVLSQCTHLTEKQAERQTPVSLLVCAGIPCSMKINRIWQLAEPCNFPQPCNTILLHEFYLATTRVLEYAPTQHLPTHLPHGLVK